MSTHETDFENRAKTHGNSAFDRWLTNPMTRMGMSMIPAGEHQDTLRLILRSAFDAGFAAGQGNIAVELLVGLTEVKK